MTRVFVLGAKGMLGVEVVARFQAANFSVITVGRQCEIDYEAGRDDLRSLLIGEGLRKSDFLVNCLGWIPQKSSNDELVDLKRSFYANSFVPAELEALTGEFQVRVIQIGTDCVFSGFVGAPYSESSIREATDIYSSSKILGEISSPSSMIIRSSIVGRTVAGNESLVDWLLSRAPHSQIDGYVNHHWNGVTVEAFARVLEGVIREELFSPGVQHLVPADQVSKFELLQMVSDLSARHDLLIRESMTSLSRDRRLSTNNIEFNNTLWAVAAYNGAPTIRDMLASYLGRRT